MEHKEKLEECHFSLSSRVFSFGLDRLLLYMMNFIIGDKGRVRGNINRVLGVVKDSESNLENIGLVDHKKCCGTFFGLFLFPTEKKKARDEGETMSRLNYD